MDETNRIEDFWAAVGAFTYAEMMQVAQWLSDTVDAVEFDADEARDWAEVLHNAGKTRGQGA